MLDPGFVAYTCIGVGISLCFVALIGLFALLDRRGEKGGSV